MLTDINLSSLIPDEDKIFGGSLVLNERVDILLITTDSLTVDR